MAGVGQLGEPLAIHVSVVGVHKLPSWRTRMQRTKSDRRSAVLIFGRGLIAAAAPGEEE
jgi:hypothetical protein